MLIQLYVFLTVQISIILTNVLNQTFNESYPITLTLSNGNIFFVGQLGSRLYDSEFQSYTNFQKFEENEMVNSTEDSLKSSICQFLNTDEKYILLLQMDYIFIYDENGLLIKKANLTNILGKSQYNLLPFKKENNNLFFIISYYEKGIINHINIIEYSIDILSGNINEIQHIDFLPRIKASTYSLSDHSMISCQILSNENYKNILSCFFFISWQLELQVLSYDLDNNLQNISDYENAKLMNEFNYMHTIKTAKMENDNITYIFFAQDDGQAYCLIYFLDNNTFSEKKELIEYCGSSMATLLINYISATGELLLSCRHNNEKYYLVTFDKNLNITSSSSQPYCAEGGESIENINRFSVFYSYYSHNYCVIYDIKFYGISQYFCHVELMNIIENRTEIIFKNNSINKNDITTTQKKNDYETIIFPEETELICDKCSNCTKESWLLKLCISCNINNNYYEVDFKSKNQIKNNFLECYNENTKPSNFFFNKNTQKYEPCYETCEECNFSGNSEIHNCTKCAPNFIFRPETPETTNCVAECKYFYYYTSYDQYKCSEINQCPEEQNLLIKTKNKCVIDCKLDDIYQYQYDGNCLIECPENTKSNNNKICELINKNECSLSKNEFDLTNLYLDNGLDLIVKNYVNEFGYTDKHISFYSNYLYKIILYKNKNCISELGISMPEIDFGTCYEKVKNTYNIKNDLLIAIIDKKNENENPITSYAFFNPENGIKLDASIICKENLVTVEENVISILNNSNIDINIISKLTNQNINIFNLSENFFSDICFHFESPNGKDVALKDRIKEFYPNVTLCDSGCQNRGVNLTTMKAICECKFNDLMNNIIISETGFYASGIEDALEILSTSNFEVMKCYKDVFKMKYFKKNLGGFIMLFLLFCQIICTIIYFFYSLNNIIKYLFNIMNKYEQFFTEQNRVTVRNINNLVSNPTKKIKPKNKIEISKMRIKHKKLSQKLPKKVFFVENPKNENNKYCFSSTKIVRTLRKKRNTTEKNITNTTNKNSTKKNVEKSSERIFELNNNINSRLNNENENNNEKNNENEFDINQYLATNPNDMDFDDAIKMDQRTFCQYFFERFEDNCIIVNTFIKENLKPISIKIMVLILNIDLYLIVNGFFFNEDYVSEIYHLENPDGFFTFVTRSTNRFLYASTVGVVAGYIISFFEIDEKRIKRVFKREKDNVLLLKYGVVEIMKELKNKYNIFILVIFFIMGISWYYLTCFNNVYPNMKGEWIKSSIMIFIVMQILYVFFALIEAALRFLSFEFKSEKIFKLSQFLS